MTVYTFALNLVSLGTDADGDAMSLSHVGLSNPPTLIDWSLGSPVQLAGWAGHLLFYESGQIDYDDLGDVTGSPVDGADSSATRVYYKLKDGQSGPSNVAYVDLTLHGLATGDTTPPVIIGMTPSGTSVPVAADPIFTASEPIVPGTSGTVKIWNETTNALIETVDLATAPSSGPGSLAQVAGQPNQIKLIPTSVLPNATEISFEFSAGSIKDPSGNPLAAIARNVWKFTTIVVTTPITTFVPDLVVSSVSAINSTLAAWAADPSGTAPSGKAPLDDRVLGYNATLPGFSLSSINLPMKVYLRPVGIFYDEVINGIKHPSCSTYINGVFTANNCNNLWMWRNDIRANNTGAFNGGIAIMNNCSNGGFLKCVGRGWPTVLVQGNLTTTARGFKINGGSNMIVENCVALYIYDSAIDAYGTINGLTWRGNMGRHSGGNFSKLATGAIVDDFLMEFIMADRRFHPYKAIHGDILQYNNGAITNRFIVQCNVGYRGHWSASYDLVPPKTTAANATQFYYSSSGGAASTGPNLFTQNLVVTGQQRGVDKLPGSSVLTTDYNTMLDSVLPNLPYPNGQSGDAPYPRIVSTNVSNKNYITASSSGYGANEGTGGVKKVLSSDHHEILDDFMAIPTDLTDLWDIRPRAGTIVDPFYSNPSARVGSFDLWSKLLLGDNRAVLSKQGWPTATIFIEDFDRSNNFGSSYTGSFDANGDNA